MRGNRLRSRQGLLLIVSWILVPLASSAGLQAEQPQDPNMLVIIADDLGYGDLSSYGAEDMRTPNIDRLADRGMRFTNFYANCPVCSPTRAALLSGRYQDLVGVSGVIRTHPENNWGFLDPDATLLSSVLTRNGYHTAAVGKWHLGLEPPNLPNQRGFDHFHGFLGDMMDDYYTHRRHGHNYMRLNRETIDPEGHATTLFTDWACDYLRQRSSEEPFFLYLAYNAPHGPIQPPEEELKKVQNREPEISKKRAKLVALIEDMDAGIGRVMQTLKAQDFDRSTIVVFTSDNGGQLGAGANNGPLRAGKGTVYEGGLKVPTIVVWPGHIEAGSVTDQAAMSLDILPTLMDAAGIEPDIPLDGRSFLPTLLGREQKELRQHWFFRRREGGNRFNGKTIDAVRRGPWKLLQNDPFGPLELYNLEQDPREQNNLIQQKPQIYRDLAAALRRQIQRYGRVPWQRAQEEAETSP